ncbi:MAG: hypothetical protein RL060_1575 [Bacteroidota bacterium]|jgi:uncharacterized protein with HEPN domain
MDNTINKLLFDVLQSIERIDSYTETPKRYAFFASNLLLQQAVERNFEIMGEAMNRILKLKPDIVISHTRKIVDTRNKIVHGYDEIEP